MPLVLVRCSIAAMAYAPAEAVAGSARRDRSASWCCSLVGDPRLRRRRPSPASSSSPRTPSARGRNRDRRLERAARARAADHRARARARALPRAVADERLRIAQELHDVVAHSMGVIAVQAGVGAHVIDKNPAKAKKSLEAISRHSARRSPRSAGCSACCAPTDGRVRPAGPGLADLDALVDDVRAAGLPVSLTISGETGRAARRRPHRVPHRAGGADQRVEARGRRARRGARRLQAGRDRIEVADNGRGGNDHGAASPTAGGHGLIGMRERVAVCGGASSRARPGGGFRVRAELPYGSRTP